MDDAADDEPTTRLSSAFFVVLILHVVAVGGIYAFNSIKAHRRGLDPAAAKQPADKTPAESGAAPKSRLDAGPGESPAGEARAGSSVSTAGQAATAPISNPKIYHVKAGDTLTKIAAAASVTVAELQFVNSPKDVATLRPGQILNLPVKRDKAPERTAALEPPAPNPSAKKIDDAAAKAGPAAPRTYDVQKGDTATSIAKKFGVGVDDLLKLNKVADPKKLQLGQTLKLPPKKN